MRFRFQFRRYRLPFRVPVRTAHGLWHEREGLLVRLEDVSEGGSGAVGFGEAAPIPEFGTEAIDEDEAGAREIGEWIEEGELLQRVPARLAGLRNAIASARAEIGRVSDPLSGSNAEQGKGRVEAPPYLSIAGLLPAGRAALAQIQAKAELGFRVFKWKVGVGELADELSLLDDVCAALPNGAKLRLDANGAWDRRKAERWLERCAERPVEFVEQPCFADPKRDASASRKIDDVLLGLAGDYPTPLALDESLVGDGDVQRWIGAAWPGVFVVKWSLLGDPDGVFAALRKARADVVFSSALETCVGARAALRAAFRWRAELGEKPARPPRALGFGVGPLFADARFEGPSIAPFVRAEDLAQLDAEAAWNALS